MVLVSVRMGRVHYVIPDELHREAKAAAALSGITLREFLERGLELAILEAGQRMRGSPSRAKKTSGNHR